MKTGSVQTRIFHTGHLSKRRQVDVLAGPHALVVATDLGEHVPATELRVRPR